MDKQTLHFFEVLPHWVPLGEADKFFAFTNAALAVTNPLLSYHKVKGIWTLKVGRREPRPPGARR